MKTLVYAGPDRNVGRFGAITSGQQLICDDTEADNMMALAPLTFLELPTFSQRYNPAKTVAYQATQGDHAKIIRLRDSLGSDLVTNGGFDSNTTSWTAYNASTLAAAGSGQAGNCLSIANGADLATNGGFATNTTGWTAAGSATLASAASGQAGNCLSITNVVDLVTNGGFASDAASWTAVGGATLASAADGQAGNCLSIANVADMVANGGFAANTTSWTAVGGATLASAGTGQAGNCLSITNDVDTAGGAKQTITTVAGVSYKLSYYFKKGTGVSAKMIVESVADAADLHVSAALTDADWAVHTVTFVATSTTTILRVLSDSAVTGETCFFDTISMATAGGAKQTVTTVVGRTYKLDYYFKKGTGVSAKMIVESVANAADLSVSAALTDAAWAAKTVTFVATSTTTILRMLSDSAVAGETCFFDSVLLSTPGGAYQSITTVAGKDYLLSYYFKKGTGVSAKMIVESALYAADIDVSEARTDAAWAAHTVAFTATGTTTIIRAMSDSAVTAETCFFDTITLTTTELGGAYQDITTVVGTHYTLTGYFKKGTAVSGSIIAESALGSADLNITLAALTDADWAAKSVDFVATTTTTTIRLMVDSTVAGQTALFDTIVLKEQVGVHILLPGDLVLNGGFASAATSWTAYQSGTLASVASGQTGNCLRITNSGANAGGAYQSFTTVAGATYNLRVYFKKGTGVSGKVVVETTAGGAEIHTSPNLTFAAWAEYEVTFTATGTTTIVRLQSNSAVASQTCFFDQVRLLPSAGTQILVTFDESATGHDLYAHRNSQLIDGAAADYTITTSMGGKGFLWVNEAFGWKSY